MLGQGVLTQGNRVTPPRSPAGAISPATIPTCNAESKRGGREPASPSRATPGGSKPVQAAWVGATPGAFDGKEGAVPPLEDPSLAELLCQRDAWRLKNVGTNPISNSTSLSPGDFGIDCVSPKDLQVWPSIEEGIQLGRGARKRLTIIP